MTISCAWLGDASETTAEYVVRSTVNGALTMVIGGTTFTGTTIDTTVNDGIGTVTATGLDPGKTYACSLLVAGASRINRVVKTMPSQQPFSVAFASCLDKLFSVESLNQSLIDLNIVAMFQQGDYIYTGNPYTNGFGETSVAVSTASPLTEYYTHHRQSHRNEGNALLDKFCPLYYQADDHEFGGDNWDHSIVQAQVAPNVAAGSTQVQVDAAWWLGNQAAIAYGSGNPTGTPADTDKPSNAAAGTAAAQYPARYFKKTIGNAEFFVIDCISKRNAVTDVDNSWALCTFSNTGNKMTCTRAPNGDGSNSAFKVGQTITSATVPGGITISSLGTGTGQTGDYNLSGAPGNIGTPQATSGYANSASTLKTMLGATQLAWLKAALVASVATFKIIVSGKAVYGQTVQDGWEQYPTERAALLAYIRDNVPTKGVMWVCGDVHNPHASYNLALEFSSVGCSPCGQLRTSCAASYATNVIWKESGQNGTGSNIAFPSMPVAGVLTCYDTYIEKRIIDSLGRTLVDPQGNLAHWRMMAGSNLLIQANNP